MFGPGADINQSNRLSEVSPVSPECAYRSRRAIAATSKGAGGKDLATLCLVVEGALPYPQSAITCSVSKCEQTATSSTCNSLHVSGEIEILAVELDGHDGLVVTFSDGTTAGYVVEELLELRPVRERVESKRTKNIPRVVCNDDIPYSGNR